MCHYQTQGNTRMDEEEAEEMRKDILELMQSIQESFDKIADSIKDIADNFDELIESAKGEDFGD